MKLALHTWGSEGDVRPVLTLAERLVEAGHQVRVSYCAAEGRDYAARLRSARFEHREIGAGRSNDELHALAAEIFAERSPLRQLNRINEALLLPMIDEFAASAEHDAGWADALVLHPFAFPLAVAGEARGTPVALLYPTPLVATRAFPPPGLPGLGPLGNGLLWWVFMRVMQRELGHELDQLRRRFGLAGKRTLRAQYGLSALQLVANSPVLIERPDDWSDTTHLCGALSPRPAQGPVEDAALEAFLGEGPPPLYVTFGSMTDAERDPTAALQLIEQAVALVGCRAIVQGGAGGPSSRRVFRVGPAPHDRLFPRCAAIVHHGGAGTTHMALRAGRPAVVVAHLVDQGFWGARLRALGVAPPHLSRRTLTAEALAAAIRVATTDEAMQRRAAALGARMREEDGPARVVQLLEGLRRLP